MPQYHSDLHDIVAKSFQDAGIKYVESLFLDIAIENTLLTILL
jgi:hypothetical protein